MTPSAEDPKDTKPEAEGGVPKVGDIIDGKVVVDPSNMARGERGRWLPGQRPITGIMPGDTNRALDMRARRTASWARGGGKGLKRAAAEYAEKHGITLEEAAEVYAEEIGKGVLANAVDKPHDASRALVNVAKMAQLIEDRQRTAQTAVQVNVVLGDRVQAAMRAAGVIVDGETTASGAG